MDCFNCANQDCQDCIERNVVPLFLVPTMHLHLPMTVSVVRRSLRDGNGMGFLPAAGAGGGAGAGAAAGPIGAAIGAAVGVVSSLIGGAKQRGRDEEASGVALQQSVDGIYRLKEFVQRGELSVDQARDIFKQQILNQFLLFVSTLKTESVRKSRSTNQKRDLENLFEKEVGSLASSFLPSRSAGSQTGPLPGYCPAGTYHPIENPMACVPFPQNAADLAAQAINQGQQETKRLEQELKARQARQRALQKAQQQAAMPCPAPQQRNPATGKCVEPGGCPPGTYPDSTGQCVVLPQCPADRLVDIQTGQCVEPGGEPGGLLSGIPWWLLLLVGAALLASSGGGDRRRR